MSQLSESEVYSDSFFMMIGIFVLIRDQFRQVLAVVQDFYPYQ